MLPDDDAKTLTDSQFEVSLGKVGPGSTVFGRYLLEKEIGRGGMGVVWLAKDERIDVQVALKFLPDVVARDSESVDELKRELRRGLSLTHPGIVRVYSFEQDPTGAAIAMEYVDGPTLSSLKLKQGNSCFDVEDLEPYIESLCAALDYAHFDARIVHRDLKPRNLMLTSKGRLKIADFGVATSISETVSRASIRKDGSGTPPYMSPQQAFGEDPSPSDDIYSLGATLFELLTGRPPFYQGNILAQVQQRVPPTMTERRQVLKILNKKPIPEQWEKTVAACLAKNPEDRPAKAGDVWDYLRGVRPPPSISSTHAPEGTINPAITLADVAPLTQPGRGPAIVDAFEDATVRGTTPARVQPVPTSRPAPQPKRKALVPLLAMIAIIGGGASLWWWQERQDDQAKVATNSHPLSPAPTVTTPAAEDPAAVEARKRADQEAADLKRLEADFSRISAGELPRPDAPWTNSLHMHLTPVPGVKALFAVTETRLQDYREFAAETKRPWTPTDGFIQGDEHPAVNVSWEDATAFCQWLTDRERVEGHLGSKQFYRLPSDLEWSHAAGLTNETGATPEKRDRVAPGTYEWTTDIPPLGAGNFAGEGDTKLSETELQGYVDGYSHTAPVGKFTPNAYGLHDMAGNVAEWVEDWFNEAKTERTVRGAAWIYIAQFDRKTSFRWHVAPKEFADYIGFRVVLDPGPMPEHLPPPVAPAVPADRPAVPAPQ